MVEITGRCPFCGSTFKAPTQERLDNLADGHLLTNTACSEKMLQQIVDGKKD